MIAKIVRAGGLELTMDNPLLGQICADVLEAKCGSSGDPKVRASRHEFLAALARHHFDGAPPPVLDPGSATATPSTRPAVEGGAAELAAVGDGQ